MRIYCNRENLLTGVNKVMKAVTGRTTLPILECILITADSQGVKLTATDLDLSIETAYMPANIEEGGSIALEAKRFAEMIKRMEGDEVYISSDEQNKTEIECGSSKYGIMGQSGDEFPAIPEVEKNDKYSLSQSTFKSMIRQTIFSVSQDESRPTLMGELLEAEGNGINLVSVDGYRISFRKARLNDEVEKISAIIPGRTLNEISKILETGEDDKVNIYFGETHVLFDLGNGIVVSRLISGEFIRYAQSFTEEYKTKAVVNRIALISALERVALVASDARKSPTKLEISGNRITITSAAEAGTAKDEINAECEGETLIIAFNHKYILDALKVIEDDEVELLFTTALSPCIIKATEGDDYKYLALPLRI